MAGNAANSGRQRGRRDTMWRLTIHARLSLLTLALGIVVMLATMYLESEPGALPLLVVVLSLGWHVITRVRMRSQQR